MAEALLFADIAATVLLHLETAAIPGSEDSRGLTDVVGHRVVVHQATGFVSVQAGVALTEALALLRAAAFSSERPIASVAHDVLVGRLHSTATMRDVGSMTEHDVLMICTAQKQ